MVRTALLINLFVFLPLGTAWAQDGRSPVAADTTERSEFTVGLSRDNRTFFLGRELDTRIPGYSPTLNYTHKSGLYINAVGFYADKNQPPPHYVFTEVEVGYAGRFTNQWTYSLSVDRLFFSKPQLTTVDIPPIRNGLEAYTTYDFGPIHTGLDYTYYFDQQNAHLLTAIIGGTLFSHKNWLGLDEVSITPSINAYWGTASVLQRYGGLYDGVLTAVSSTGGTPIRQRRRKQTTTPTAPIVAGRFYGLGAELTVPFSVTWLKTTLTLTNHTIMTTQLPDESKSGKLINFLSFGIARTFR